MVTFTPVIEEADFAAFQTQLGAWMQPTYEAWLRFADCREEDAERGGQEVARIGVDPKEFAAWLSSTRSSRTLLGLIQFAAQKAAPAPEPSPTRGRIRR